MKVAENIETRSRPFTLAALRAAGVVLHRWLGITVGLVFMVTGLTGAVITYAPELTGMLFPAIDGPAPAGWMQRRAAILDITMAAHARGDVTLIRFPTEQQGAYEIYLADESHEYRDALTGDVVLVRTPLSDVLNFSRDLHTHLMMGHDGEELLGWLGVAMLVLVATGLWLWWPRFGLWRTAFAKPRSSALSPQLFWLHKTIGFVALPVLFFVTLTGVGMVFYYPAQALLTGMLGGEAPVIPQTLPADAAGEATDWNAVIAALDTTLPDGRTVFVSPQEKPDDVLMFRKQMPGELHPNGRSFIAITPAGDVLHATDASRLEAGMRATHAIYPLHSGKTPSETWRFLVFLAGIAPTFFFITGFWLWRLRRRRARRV